MRGAFSAGVLDIFLEQGFDVFSVYGGTSGGAMNLSSFLSGQHGRNFGIYRDICTSPHFISARKYLGSDKRPYPSARRTSLLAPSLLFRQT